MSQMPSKQEPVNDNFISLEEASDLLEADEKEIHQLIDEGRLNAYQIGGEYIRLRKDQISEIKARWRINRNLFPESKDPQHLLVTDKANLFERVRDFFYFNDFYIISALVIAAFVYLIISS